MQFSRRAPAATMPAGTMSENPVDADASPLAQLLQRIQNSEPSAFDELYCTTFPIVFRIADAVLRDRSQAEEVTQEVFVEIWRRADQFDPTKGSAMSWIWRVAHARAVDRVRHAQSARTNDHRYAQQEFDRDIDSVTDTVLRNADVAAIQEALNRLTPLQRQALTMIYFAGHTNLYASALLGIPLPTLKSRVQDGLSSLRRVHESLS